MHLTDLDPARIGDAVALWRANDLTRPWNNPVADAEQALDGPASTVLALLDDDHLVATAMVGFDGHRGWVYYVAVDPARQGEGLGRTIMDAAVEWLDRRGCVKLQLLVRNTNGKVRAFYEHLGFQVEETFVMSKRLAERPDN